MTDQVGIDVQIGAGSFWLLLSMSGTRFVLDTDLVSLKNKQFIPIIFYKTLPNTAFVVRENRMLLLRQLVE